MRDKKFVHYTLAVIYIKLCLAVFSLPQNISVPLQNFRRQTGHH